MAVQVYAHGDGVGTRAGRRGRYTRRPQEVHTQEVHALGA